MKARYLWVATAFLVAGTLASLAWQVQQMGWLQLGRVARLSPEMMTAHPTTGPAQPDLGAIAAFAPFGETPDIAQDSATRNDTPRSFDFVLRGTLALGGDRASRAFLSDGRTTTAYRIGDEVAEGIVLVEVLSDTIVLEVDGERVTFGFGGAIGADTADQPMAEASPEEVARDPLAQLAAALRPGRGSLDLRAGPPPDSVDGYIDLWRNRIQKDPQGVMDTIGVENIGRGYRIKPDPNIGVTLAGLQPGDIVTRLNGQTVGNIDRDRELYDQVAAAGVARLEVERSGETLLMTFSLR